MANSVKTAISIHKDLFNEVNSLASELNLSRSKVFVLAAQDFIKKYHNRSLLKKINQAYSESPDSEEIKIANKMKTKQNTLLERESWK